MRLNSSSPLTIVPAILLLSLCILNKRHTLPFLLVVLSLAFNQLGASLVTSKRLDLLNAQQWQDAVVLCTTKGFAWYSQSIFAETGELVEISPPVEQANLELEHYECALGLSVDVNSDTITSPWLLTYMVWLALPDDEVFTHSELKDNQYPAYAQRAPPIA